MAKGGALGKPQFRQQDSFWQRPSGSRYVFKDQGLNLVLAPGSLPPHFLVDSSFSGPTCTGSSHVERQLLTSREQPRKSPKAIDFGLGSYEWK